MDFASIASTLTPLALLACPLGMGAMMWMMARGNRKNDADEPTDRQPVSVEVLREEQRRLSEEIDRLEGADAPQPTIAQPR